MDRTCLSILFCKSNVLRTVLWLRSVIDSMGWIEQIDVSQAITFSEIKPEWPGFVMTVWPTAPRMTVSN